MSDSIRAFSVAFLLGSLASCGGDPVSEPSTDEQGRLIPPAALGALNAQDQHGRRHIAIVDDCDASDPAWNATGGCALRGGAVRDAEFGAFLESPLAAAVVGHPAWRMEPSYLRASAGKSVAVTNQGGRLHSFTPVALYGGGRVAPFNVGLAQAPECAPTAPGQNPVAAGGRLELNLAAGNHRFQCCFHPWMRALIKVE